MKAPIPERMASRTENESQFGQLVRWWMWVLGDIPMGELAETLEIKRDTAIRGLRVGQATTKMAIAFAAIVWQEVELELSTLELENLSEVPASEGDMWREYAARIQTQWLDSQ